MIFKNLKKFLYRARVEAVDVVGGMLEQNPPNPPGSLRARIYTSGLDATTPASALTIFHPFHPPGSIPTILPGEHVYVMFEDMNNFSNGFWTQKIPNYSDINYANPDDVSPQQQSSADIFEERNSNSQQS